MQSPRTARALTSAAAPSPNQALENVRPTKVGRANEALALGLVLLLTGSACHGHHRDYDDDDDRPPVYDEQEPNDWADHPDFMGKVDSTSLLYIEGHIQEAGPDVYDGFHFIAVEPCTIEFALAAERDDVDLDLAVYDPFIDEFVLTFESPDNPERGSFVVLDAGQEFHLVVASFAGSGYYTLEVLGLPPTAGPQTEAGLEGRILRGATESQPAQPSVRRLFKRYRGQELPAVDAIPGILFQVDESDQLREAAPVLLTAVGALLGLRRSQVSQR